MINGCPEKDIPVLDPYEIEDYRASSSGDILSYTINIDDGLVAGFSDFEIIEFNINKTNLSTYIKAFFPVLLFQSGYYTLEGNIFQVLPLGGRGIMQFNVFNLTVSSKIFFTQSTDEKSLLIDNFENSSFHIQRISGHIEIDNNIDEIFNTMIKDLPKSLQQTYLRCI